MSCKDMDRIQHLTREIQRVRSETMITDLRARISDLEAQITALTAALTDRDDHINAFNVEIARLTTENAELVINRDKWRDSSWKIGNSHQKLFEKVIALKAENAALKTENAEPKTENARLKASRPKHTCLF